MVISTTGSLPPAGRVDGRIGIMATGAEAIHHITLNGVDPQRYFTDLPTPPRQRLAKQPH